MNRATFSNPQILGYAKALMQDQGKVASSPRLARQAAQVTSSIESGRFELPRGAKGAFSQAQFSKVHDWLYHFPVRGRLVARAEAFATALPSLIEGPEFEVFGSWANKRFSHPLSEAKNLHLRCPRKPQEFTAGEFGPSQLCDLVKDMHRYASYLEETIDILESPGFLRRSGDLVPKIDLLLKLKRVDLITPLIVSVHKVFLGRDGERELEKVMYHGAPIAGFMDFLVGRELKRNEETQNHWKANFQMIRSVAASLCDSSSYSHSHLTRQLRRDLGACFAVAKDPEINGGGYFIRTSTHLELGRGEKITSCFELVNWAAALEERLGEVTFDVFGYWDLVAHAKSRLSQLRESENQSPLKREFPETL
ncbi:hypothetical protein ACRCPS_17830 [Pseudomonas aeruginosa]